MTVSTPPSAANAAAQEVKQQQATSPSTASSNDSRGSSPDDLVETLMQGMQRIGTTDNVAKGLDLSVAGPSPPKENTKKVTGTAAVIQEYTQVSGIRRHSMPNVVGTPFAMNGTTRFSQPNSLGFIPEHRSVGPTSAPIPTAIGHSRNSANVYPNEMPPSAAQWYFGATPSTSLSNLLPPQSQMMPPPMRGAPSMGSRMHMPHSSVAPPPPMPNAGRMGPGVGAAQPMNGGGVNSQYFEYQTAGLPAGAVNPSGSLQCFLVQFTSGRTDTYYIPYDSTLMVTVGDYVIVEADRGEDLGRVFMDNITVPLPRRNSTTAAYSGAMPGNQFETVSPTYELDDFATNNISGYGGTGSGPTPPNFPKRIYRIAQAIEIESLLGKVRDEVNAIAVGQYKVQEWKLPMAIIDAEYQWFVRSIYYLSS